MTKKGKLIGIGVGPGDTELLTLKAAKVLKSVPVVFSPNPQKKKRALHYLSLDQFLKKGKITKD